MPLALVDNRDSFTWNLVQLLWTLDQEVVVLERSRATLDDLRELAPERIVVGPGPGHAREAELSLAIFEAFEETPVLGVCLGHQALALAAGARITSAPELAHGRPVEVHHAGQGLFRGLTTPFRAGRYHSLTVAPEELPPELEITARSAIGEVLGLAHTRRPHLGVQFHPESILSELGSALVANFLGC